MRHAVFAPIIIALVAGLAAAQERLDGGFDLTGTRSSGGSYAGTARVHPEGSDLVLAVWLDGAARPLLRAPASATGPWTFTGATQAGVAGTLDGLLGGAPGASVTLRVEVRRTATGFEARVLEDGRLVAREALTPRASTFAISTFALERARFCPYRTEGPNAVAVRYAIDPPGLADVEARIIDKDGREVARTTQRGVRADGAGATFTWDGRDAARACVDARRSPYRITLRATRAGTTVASAPVEVVAVPRLDACVVVSSVNGAEATTANKVVAHDADVHLVALVRAVVAGARPEEPGRTDRAWFVASDDAGIATAVLPAPTGRVTLATWDEGRWPALTLAWQEVRARGLHSPAYRATQDAQRLTRDGEFTNVVSNGDDEGRWLGHDILEYEHVDRGAGSTLAAHASAGTARYRVDADLADPALSRRVGSPGRRDPQPTTAAALRSGLLDGFSRDLSGVAPQVHRISRRGPSSNALLSHLEAYRGVPWLYGSLGPQAQEFIGYDCADLVFAAARRAGLTTRNAFTNANALCRTYCKSVGLPVVRFDDAYAPVNDKTGAAVALNLAKPGDVVFFDWDGDGDWDHTTVLWEMPSGKIDLSSTFAWAHHEAGCTDGFHTGPLSELIHSGTQPTTKMTVRRF
jgi:cell wall-associated NlpC family hydrolase